MKKSFISDELINSSIQKDQPFLMADLYGINYQDAVIFLEGLGLKVFEITYEESSFDDFTIIRQNIKPGEKICKESKIILTLSGQNPINFLPSVYLENDEKNNSFLKRFLWIFQHVMNSLIFKLDNTDKIFDPMTCSADFFNWMLSWFYKSFDYDIPAAKLRKFLKKLFYLNMYRGTGNSLSLLLEIITDIRPEIIENYIPAAEFKIENEILLEKMIIERNYTKNLFTVYFPVYRDYFNINTIKAIDRIIKSEKPVNSEYYILFKKKEEPVYGNDFIIGTNLFIN